MTILPAKIYETCLKHHAEVKDLDFVLKESIPVPYFGDVRKFLESPIRVVTAALHPSDHEFPKDNPSERFSIAVESAEDLESELCQYFTGEPLSWFNAFEPVLNGIGSSYGGGKLLSQTYKSKASRTYESTALHLDVCSPIATGEKWSDLTPMQRGALTTTGREIFEQLLDVLQPHLVVASLGWDHMKDWSQQFQAARSWPAIVSYTESKDGKAMRRPLKVQVGKISLRGGGTTLWAHGSAAQSPFGQFLGERRVEAGRALLNYVNGKRQAQSDNQL